MTSPRPSATAGEFCGRATGRRLGLLACLLAACAAFAALFAGPVWAQNVRDACFSAADLAARPGEKAPRKGERAFDRSEPQRALAAFQPVPSHLRGAIRRVRLPHGQKLVALTLDLCEQPGEIAGYDGAIIDYLRREGVKATLFVGGKWLRSHEERARQLIADPLFEIANHAAAHRNLRTLSGSRLAEEITAPQRAYEAIHEGFGQTQCVAAAAEHWRRVPRRMALFRFPFGACNKASLDAVNDAGLLAIQWDVSTGDPAPGQSAAQIARAIVQGTKPGSIVIGHANGRGFNTAAALPLAIPKLKAQGYRFVTVSELLAAGEPEVVASCYNVRPGDTDRYDDLATAFRRDRQAGSGARSVARRTPVTKPGRAKTVAPAGGWTAIVNP